LQWKDSANVSLRKAAASALGRAYLYSELEFEDRCAAEAALTVLLDDPSEKVRYALAEAICSSADAPAQVINALVNDQYEIASLIVARSPIINDRDLVARVETAENRLQVAIANRPQVSNRLALAIASKGCADAAAALLSNFNADVCVDSRKNIVSRHVDKANVRGALLNDQDLEPNLRLKVMKAASEALSSMPLFGKRRENGSADIVLRDAEQQALAYMAGQTNNENVDDLIEALRTGGDLTTQLLIRVACQGKMDFLSRVIASLSGQTAQRVTSILVNERSTQLYALLAKAGFSTAVQPVFANSISLWRDVAQGRIVAGAQEVTRQIMERLEADNKDRQPAANDDIMALLRSIYLETMRDNARRHAVDLANAA
ncbi:MAG: DUF2336 domain-containing protein, partial [Pseudomonadota bacterium]